MPSRRLTLGVAVLCVTALAGTAIASGTSAAATTAPSTAYRANDYADGQAMSILPPGENGLVNATDAVKFELTQTRPPASDDQLGKYSSLIYSSQNLTDAGLSAYYDDESFGVQPGDVTRTEQPESGVTIYRDTHDVPHIYGNTDQTMAFGAGYAQAEDRLFLMDVLRHYGSGTLASFLGSSCEFEQMDHDQLLLSAYTPAQAQAQVDALPTEYGAQGALAKSLIDNFVAGINAYIDQTRTNPALLPADYAAALDPAAALDRCRRRLDRRAHRRHLRQGRRRRGEPTPRCCSTCRSSSGRLPAASAFQQFKEQNDPAAPTTVVDKSFPYEIPGKINPATTAHARQRASAAHRRPDRHHPGLQPHARPTRRRPRS